MLLQEEYAGLAVFTDALNEHINTLAAQFGETGNMDYLLENYTLYDNYDTLLKEYNDKYTQYEETQTAYRDALEAYPKLLTQHQSESDSYADIVAMQEAGKNGGFSWKNLAYFVGAYEKAGWDELTQNPISPQFNPINYVRQGISFYSTAFTLAKALSSHDITGKDLLKILGNEVSDSLMGDLLYLTENTYLFQHFSEISPEQAWELGERTRGAVIELEKIGATVYGLAKSISDYYSSRSVAQNTGEINFSSLDDFVNDPNMLSNMNPTELYNYLKSNGYNPLPLSRGSTAGYSFEQGGGFKVNWGGDRILQYHPGGGVHSGSYWKISSGLTGTVKISISGDYIP